LARSTRSALRTAVGAGAADTVFGGVTASPAEAFGEGGTAGAAGLAAGAGGLATAGGAADGATGFPGFAIAAADAVSLAIGRARVESPAMYGHSGSSRTRRKSSSVAASVTMPDSARRRSMISASRRLPLKA